MLSDEARYRRRFERRRQARRRRLGVGLSVAVAIAVAVGLAFALGNGERSKQSRALTLTPSLPSYLTAELRALPPVAALRRQLLIGDLARLRHAYPDPASFRRALSGVWFPDALAGVGTRAWQKTLSIDLAGIDRFVAAGLHPNELAVVEGRFPAAIERALRRQGYRSSGGLMMRGRDGSFDASTAVGRLALSSLDRVIVRPRRMTAASTSMLARASGSSRSSLADDRQLVEVLAALGPTTCAVVVPAGVLSPPEGVLVTPLAPRSARLIAVGVDDAGALERTLKIALLYASGADARVSAAAFTGRLARLPVVGLTHSRPLGSLVGDLRVRIVARSSLLITARIKRGQDSGLWRTLFESGDLAPLVRPL